MTTFSNWTAFESWLERKGLFHIDFGLGRMEAALSACRMDSCACFTVQVLGTNGKGSTCAFLESLARKHGLKTGLYTSPHFTSVKERIRINGLKIPDSGWLDAVNRLAVQTSLESLTYFETVTLLAARLFQDYEVDFAIVEAGLGGWHDATSALPADMHCFCPIALDHGSVIGPGLREIANDKALAIRPGAHVLAAPQYPEAASILKKQARKNGAAFEFTKPLPPGALDGALLNGKIQHINAGLALTAWRAAAERLDVPSEFEKEGLQNAFLAGRRQRIPKNLFHSALLLDGAHNPHAIHNLLADITHKPEAVVFSALADKNWQDSVAMLLRLDCRLLVPQLDNMRAADADEITAWANKIRPGCAVRKENLREALASCKSADGFVPVCGSLFLLSDFFTLYPQYLEKD